MPQGGVAAVLSDKDTIESILMTNHRRLALSLAIQTPYAFTVEHSKRKYWLAYRSKVFHSLVMVKARNNL